MPASSARVFAVILSPIFFIVSEVGPINLNPLFSHISAKFESSAKNP